MTDRIPGAPGRCKAVVTGQELQKLQAGEEFAITLRRDDQPIKEGTPYSKASVLPDELASRLCPGVQDPSPKDAFAALHTQKADTVRYVTGRTIILRDAAHTPLMGLKLFGKTTQNGVPTPDAPVIMESAGKDGGVEVKVMGKNLWRFENEIVATADNNSGWRQFYDLPVGVPLTLSADITKYPDDTGTNTRLTFQCYYTDGTYDKGASRPFDETNAERDGITRRKTATVTPDPNKTIDRYLAMLMDYSSHNGRHAKAENIQIEIGTTATEYEPYKEPQTLAVPTPNGLPGIGEYCDEIDFANGTYIKRVETVVLDGSENWVAYDNSRFGVINSFRFYTANLIDCVNISGAKNYSVYSNYFCWGGYVGMDVPTSVGLSEGGFIYLRFDGENDTIKTAEELKAWLASKKAEGNPVAVQYVLAEPIVTPLTAEQLEAYDEAALHTCAPNTTILNDAGADMELIYYTPTTAVQMVHSPADKGKTFTIDGHGCVVLAPYELGSAKETFRVVVDKDPIEDDYIGGTGYHIGIYATGSNSNLFGKTLRIKTYAYGQMRYTVNGIDATFLDHTLEDKVINPDADVTKDPQSGVCEFDVYVPTHFGEINILVPFVNNPYTEFEIHEKKGTAWEEIKSLSDKGVIASGGGIEDYWRKWNDGTAEWWLRVDGEFRYETDTLISVTSTLPFEFVEVRTVFTNITGGKTPEDDGDPIYVATAALSDYFMYEGLLDLYMASPYSDWDFVQGYVYMLGRWKYV